MNTVQIDESDRAEQVAGDLERLAAFVRANPDTADPISRQRFLLYLNDGLDAKTQMADLARAGLRAKAVIEKEVDDTYAKVVLRFGTVRLQVYAYRSEVCERVVVGTREVEITEPDPELLAAVPTVTRKTTVEDVTWECRPLLEATSDTAQAPAEVPR